MTKARPTQTSKRRVLVVAVALGLLVSIWPSTAAAADYEAKVAYIRVGADGWSYELVIGNAAGGSNTVPLNRPALSRPAISPDGTRVAFISPITDGTDGRFALFVSNLDGTNIQRLTMSSGADSDPAWSADGNFIAFSRDTKGSLDPLACCVIRVVQADGMATFTVPGTTGGINPAWSPDGTEIVYQHPAGLTVTSLDGASSRTIAGSGAAQPAWAPDGSAIAYVAPTGGGWELVTRAPNGGQRTVRVTSPLGLESPVFAPDSETLYYVRYRGEGYDGRTVATLWMHHPADGASAVYTDGASPMIHASLNLRSPDLPRCDVTADGRGDLLIGAPSDDDAVTDAGSMTVVVGASSGLGAATQWHQNVPGVLGVANAGDEFGAAVACGDFNGDGHDEAAIGTPGNGSGVVNVLIGRASGLSASNDQIWSQDSAGVLGNGQAGDGFGAAVASGDFDRDGYLDLAVGAPNGSGTVNVLYGSAAGLTASGDELWKPSDFGLTASMTTGLGHSIAGGDINGDRYADLVVGIPGATIDGVASGGFGVLLGSATGLTAPTFWSQHSSGVAGVPHAGDQLGWSVTVADLDADGFGDTVVGAPGAGHGSVNVMYGSPAGPSIQGDQVWKQNSPGILGVGRGTDRFGTAVAAGDLNGDGFGDLAVGVPGSGPGAVNVIYGSAKGLTSAGNQIWKQNTPGVLGVANVRDAFGTALTINDFDGDQIGDLAIGVPGNGPGAVNVLFGSPGAGLTAAGDAILKQGRGGIPGIPGGGDAFGNSVR